MVTVEASLASDRADATAIGLSIGAGSTHMNEVLPGLWIGDVLAATDGPLLAAHGVRQVVSVVRGSLDLPSSVAAYVIPVDDDELADLLKHLPRAVDVVSAALRQSGGGVLIHCQAGMSRSATVVAAYLMATMKLPLAEALDRIRAARPCVQPSDAFLAQLEVFELAGHRVSAEDKVTRAFYRERMASDMLAGRRFDSGMSLLARLPTHAPSSTAPGPTFYRNRKLRCASCRHELALREHVLHLPFAADEPPSNPAPLTTDAGVPAADRPSTPEGYSREATITAGHSNTTIYSPQPILDPKSTCSGYFIEPMGWMDPLFDGTVAGKLPCPNTRCKAKLGSFNWAGQKCGCKAWITPGFCLSRGKVDDISY